MFERQGAGVGVILGLAAAALAIYLGLALVGDLSGRLALLLPAWALLSGLMLWGWRAVRARPGRLPSALAAALLFRLAASCGPPALSDDVYRYVWDGRVQLHGVHPYRYAPAAPELSPLRDELWGAINHSQVPTIYPPLAQYFFLGMAALGAGPSGFKLLLGLVDFGVVLALDGLLRRASLPRDRLILYAWNPLAVLETAGSGHIEPLGVLLVVLAGVGILDHRRGLSTLALAASAHVKLLPALLLPAALRGGGARGALGLAFALSLPVLPYALTGPAVGAGLFAYSERWEHNATIYRAVEHALPRPAARLLVATAAAGWIVLLALRRRLAVPRHALWALGGVLLLSPTLHPWYLLWVLPWATALASPGWLVLCTMVVLAYSNPGGDVATPIKLLEFTPPLAVAAWTWLRGRRP